MEPYANNLELDWPGRGEAESFRSAAWQRNQTAVRQLEENI